MSAAKGATTHVNPVKARLAADKPCVGLLITMPSVHMTQLMAHAGFDWLFIDMEHGPIDLASAHAMIAATAGTGAAPFVRVPWNLHWMPKPILDAGAMGVIFPMIRTAEEAAAAVSSLRYPPAGERGFGPFYAPARWGLSTPDYVARADEEVFTLILIEHKEAIENVESIVADPGIDAALIAPFDLSLSFGHRDGPDHPEVREAIAHAEQAILKSGVPLGGLALTPERANEMIAAGYRMIAMGYDAMLIERAAADVLGGIKR